MAKAAPKKAAARTAKGPAMKLTEFTAASVKDAIAATGAKTSGKLLLVPIDKIHVVPGFNLRVTDTPEYVEGIEELKNSIMTEGFYMSKPLSGFPAQLDGDIVIAMIDGHRRLEAAKAAVAAGAEIEALPVVLKDPKETTDLDLAVSLHKENTGVPLSMLERAVLAHRLMRAGETEEYVASRLDVTVRYVNDLKVLIAAPRAIRDLIKEGKLSGTEAVKRLRADPTGQSIIDAAEKAEARASELGAAKEAKLTKQTLDGGGAPAVKMVTERLNFKATEGATFVFEDAKPFLPLLGEDWFKNAKKKAERTALMTVEIEVKIRRPKVEEEVEAETVKPVAAAPAKGGKGGNKPAPADEDLSGGVEDDDDLGGVPDLRSLGIAEPAGAEL